MFYVSSHIRYVCNCACVLFSVVIHAPPGGCVLIAITIVISYGVPDGAHIKQYTFVVLYFCTRLHVVPQIEDIALPIMCIHLL